MEASSALLMIKTLDALAARSVVTSQNIANAGTQNYLPLRLTFEDALREAAARGDDAVRQVQPQISQAAPNTPDAELRLDRELATASTTSLRYSALVEVLNRQCQIAELAVAKD